MHKKVTCGDLPLCLLHSLVIRFVVYFSPFRCLHCEVESFELPSSHLLFFSYWGWRFGVMQFYVDTVKQMALRQLVAGSPLRTLCLLIAGQPADVFSTETTADPGLPSAVNVRQQPAQVIY